MASSTLAAVNRHLDALPRTRFGALAREVPAFRACGVVGFHAAVIATLAAALLGGRSLLIAAALAALSGLSFFVYALARRRIAGREQLVLLEHVWFTLVCTALAARWLGGGAASLDPVAVGLAFFLAFGRLGCTLVGCCHGRPSSVGLVYDERHATEGFPRHLVGVRLLPVPLIEAAGLLVIGVTGLAAMPFAPPGHVLAWLLLAYAPLRFGLEGLRGDRRPQLLGLSQSRWMALVELAAAIVWLEHDRGAPLDVRALAAWGFLGATLLLALMFRRFNDPRRTLLSQAHLREVRALLQSLKDTASDTPAIASTSRRVSIGVSRVDDDTAHVSLALPGGRRDVELMCELAAASVRAIAPERAELGEAALHLMVPASTLGSEPAEPGVADALYGAVVHGPLEAERPLEPDGEAGSPPAARRGYFASSVGSRPLHGAHFGWPGAK